MDKKSWSVHKLGDFICVATKDPDYMIGLTRVSARELAESLLDHVGGSPAAKDDDECGHGWLSNILKEVRPGGRSFIGDCDSLIRRAEDLEEKAKSSERRESEIRQLRGAIANTCQQLKTLTRQRDGLAVLCEETLSRGCQCEGCVGELRQRLAELTKKEAKE